MDAEIKIGGEYKVKIIEIGAKGDGLTKINGKVVFVPNTKKGDVVDIIITNVLDKCAFAQKQ